MHAWLPCPLSDATSPLTFPPTRPPAPACCLQWPRSFRAAEWWERSALEAVDNGTYGDALPLLQKAQVGRLQPVYLHFPATGQTAAVAPNLLSILNDTSLSALI